MNQSRRLLHPRQPACSNFDHSLRRFFGLSVVAASLAGRAFAIALPPQARRRALRGVARLAVLMLPLRSNALLRHFDTGKMIASSTCAGQRQQQMVRCRLAPLRIPTEQARRHRRPHHAVRPPPCFNQGLDDFSGLRRPACSGASVDTMCSGMASPARHTASAQRTDRIALGRTWIPRGATRVVAAAVPCGGARLVAAYGRCWAGADQRPLGGGRRRRRRRVPAIGTTTTRPRPRRNRIGSSLRTSPPRCRPERCAEH